MSFQKGREMIGIHGDGLSPGSLGWLISLDCWMLRRFIKRHQTTLSPGPF